VKEVWIFGALGRFGREINRSFFIVAPKAYSGRSALSTLIFKDRRQIPGADEVGQPLLIISMAEKGIEVGRLAKLLDRARPYGLAFFDRHNSARHAVVRGFDLDLPHHLPPMGRANSAMTARP